MIESKQGKFVPPEFRVQDNAKVMESFPIPRDQVDPSSSLSTENSEGLAHTYFLFHRTNRAEKYALIL